MVVLRKMKAVIFTRPERAIIDEVDIPRMDDEDVLVEIEYSGVSNGTERWCFLNKLNPDGAPPLTYPHVPGYQAAGIIREVGPKVLGLKPGDRVFSRNCKSPKGWKGTWWGGHTGYHVAHYQSVIKLPDGVSTQEASFLLLAQVGFNGATRPRIIPGDAAVVIGDGLVGQYAAQVLKYRGAYVIMTGLMEDRLKLAALYSADEVINAGQRDIRQYIKEKYPEGVSVVVETASKLDLIRTAIDLIKRNGQVVLNGYYPQGENLINYHWLRDKETTIYCPNSRTRERLELTLELIERGYMRVKELITHEFDIAKAPDAYTNLLDNSAHFLGMVFKWKRGQA